MVKSAATLIRFSRFGGPQDAVPSSVEDTWGNLVHYLTHHVEAREKKTAGWSPAWYDGASRRANENVVEVGCLVLDFDKVAAVTTWEFLAGYESVIHSTYSHGPESPCFRVVLPLALPVSARDWPAFYGAALDYLGVGELADKSCKDPARFYYAPAHRRGVVPVAIHQEGDWLNPAKVWDHEIDHKPVIPSGRGIGEYAFEEAVVAKALERCPEGRNNACFWLCTQVRDNGLGESDCLRIVNHFLTLVPILPGKEPFTEREALRTMKSAYAAPARRPWQSTQNRQGGTSGEADIFTPLRHIVKRLKQNPDLAFEHTFLASMAELQRRAPVEYLRLLAQITPRVRNWERAFREFQNISHDEGGGGEGEVDDEFIRRAKDYLEDAFDPEMIIPGPWEIRSGRVGKIRATKDGEDWAPVFYGPVQVVGRAYGRDGSQFLCLAWRQGGTPWVCRLVPRDQAVNSVGLGRLSKDGFPWREQKGREAGDYISAVESANLTRLPTIITSAQLGWQRQPGSQTDFLLPHDVISNGKIQSTDDFDPEDPTTWTDSTRTVFVTEDDGRRQICEAVSTRGSLDEWKMLAARAANYPRVGIMLLASLAAPLLDVVGCPSFGVDISSRTTTGKTTSLRLAATVWGSPDERRDGSFMNTWDVTLAWQERACATRSHLPLILDDTARASREKGGNFGQIVYAIVSGRGRGRGSVGGIQRTETYRVILLSSGEQPITSFTTDGGVRTRVLVVTGVPFGERNSESGSFARDISLLSLQHYGWAGPEFVRWIQENWKHQGEWKARWERLSRYYAASSASPEASRLADYAALLSLTFELARKAELLPRKMVDPVSLLWASIAEQAEDASGCEACLERTVAFYQQNASRFLSPAGYQTDSYHSLAGMVTKSLLCFFRPELEKLISEWGYSPTAILSEWKELGHLSLQKKRGAKEVTTVVGVGGKSYRVVGIQLAAIEKYLRNPAEFALDPDGSIFEEGASDCDLPGDEVI